MEANMTPSEFHEIAAKLSEIEDYLRRQADMARAIDHEADALTLDTALGMTVSTHALCQLLVEHE